MDMIKRDRIFSIIIGLFILTLFCIVSSFIMVYTYHSNADLWFTLMTVTVPLLIATIGGWANVKAIKKTDDD